MSSSQCTSTRAGCYHGQMDQRKLISYIFLQPLKCLIFVKKNIKDCYNKFKEENPNIVQLLML